jgi:hypothetical protein
MLAIPSKRLIWSARQWQQRRRLRKQAHRTFSVGWAPTLSQYFTRSKFNTTCFEALLSGKGSYLQKRPASVRRWRNRINNKHMYIRAEVLYVFAVPLAASISSNDTIKRQRLHAQALQTQPDNHVERVGGEWAARERGGTMWGENETAKCKSS